MAKRVSIINFKGGVGKTTLSFNLAAGIVREQGNRVLLVDIDHQSSLSISCLGTARWQEAVENNRTVSEGAPRVCGSARRGRHDHNPLQPAS